MNLSQIILGIDFKNPLVTASGKWAWEAMQMQELARAGAAAITTKSFWNHAHKGNDNPIVVERKEWTLNAVGLPDHGTHHSNEQLQEYLAEPPVPLIVSILGLSKDEYADNAARIASFHPAAVEVNLSSPTFLKLKGSFYDTTETIAVVEAVKKEIGDIPLFAKLTPNIADIGGLARSCIEAGANGITAINTVGPAMAIDLQTRKPILSAKRGGLSGPGVKPIAVRCIADIYQATDGEVPIIGTGGVQNGEDAIELLMAGASLVGIGTTILQRGPEAITNILHEIEQWCNDNTVEDITEIIGAIHK